MTQLTKTDPTEITTELPRGCQMFRNGLQLAEGTTQADWSTVGRNLTQVAGGISWAIGDWLVFGDSFFLDKKGEKRIPDGLYAQLAAETGYAEQTLTNAKYVCLALPRSWRQERLAFQHALEIVSRVPAGQHKEWIDKTVSEKLTVKALREMLRKSKAVHKTEPNDHGVVSILEVYRQFVRDHSASSAKKALTPEMRRELLKILTPVLRDLSPGG